MNHTNCPICYEELEVVETTPCIDCGASENSLNVLRIDQEANFAHDSVEYATYRAFEKLEVKMCSLCTLDFATYHSSYFGFKNNKVFSPDDFQFLKKIENPKIVKDKYCKNCNQRLAFSLFVKNVRDINNA